MSNNQEIFAKRLKQARENKGLSQRAAARQFGCSQAAFSLWETEQNMPELDTMVRLAEFFSVQFDWLTGTTGELKIVSSFEVNTVPLLSLEDLARWDVGNARGGVQSTECYLPASAAAVEINNSFMPSICLPGDIAIIERDQKLESNAYYFVTLTNNLPPTLRRCDMDGGDIYFMAEAAISPIYFEPGVKVIGRLVEVVKRRLF